MILIAEAICAGCWSRSWRSRPCPPSAPAGQSRRAALLAWMVVIDPSWPVVIACSMSKASSPRTSPTMMRSGRMRSAFLTSSRWRISPRPSILGGRVSRRPTCGCCSCSSAASSMVIRRSLSRDVAGQRIQECGLAAAGAAGDEDREARLARPRQHLRHRLRSACRTLTRASMSRGAWSELADRDQRPIDGDRPDRHVDARAVGQPGVDHRLGFIDAAPDCRRRSC